MPGICVILLHPFGQRAFFLCSSLTQLLQKKLPPHGQRRPSHCAFFSCPSLLFSCVSMALRRSTRGGWE